MSLFDILRVSEMLEIRVSRGNTRREINHHLLKDYSHIKNNPDMYWYECELVLCPSSHALLLISLSYSNESLVLKNYQLRIRTSGEKTPKVFSSHLHGIYSLTGKDALKLISYIQASHML